MSVRCYTRKRMWTKEIFNIESPFLPRTASSGAQAFRVPSEKSVKQTNENEKSARRRSKAISPSHLSGARLERDRNRNGECTVTHNFKLEKPTETNTETHGTGEEAKKKQFLFVLLSFPCLDIIAGESYAGVSGKIPPLLCELTEKSCWLVALSTRDCYFPSSPAPTSSKL